MGRPTSWLAAKRPEMVEVLKEIEGGSSYTNGGASRGDLSLLLARLAKLLTARDGRPRSVSAMRQAWWRWTSDSAQAATPSVRELALIVRHAKDLGWLNGLRTPSCLALVDRLMHELEATRAAELREMEATWTPEARKRVLKLFTFFEARLAKHADQEVELAISQDREVTWDVGNPPGFLVQEEAAAMFTVVVEQILLGLQREREVFAEPIEADSLIQPFQGWPTMLRAVAASLSETLNGFAKDVEAYEASLLPAASEESSGPKRTKLFRHSLDESTEVELEPDE